MGDFWIILTGCLVAVPCALLGSVLVLRKMVMVGDAISHAVLPGIVLAFMFTKSFDSTFMLVFAAFFGVLSTVLIELFHKSAKLQEDASIGVTFTWLFSIGIILISTYTKQTDLDLDCVLYGEILNVPFDIWLTDSGLDLGPRAVWVLGFVNLCVLLYFIFFYKEVVLITFDPSYAAVIGLSIGLWHYLLMSLVSLVTVSAFESVGAILVVAFLVIPAASAYLITQSFKNMLVLSVLLAISSVFGGFIASDWLNTTVSGMIASFAGFQFLVIFLYTLFKQRIVKREISESTELS